MRPGAVYRAAWLLLAVLVPAAAPADEPLRIGKITIRSLNVFSPEEAARGWFYRAADALHIETREPVLRRFLLFREGDPYVATRLEETERNLRALPFLKSASVAAGPPHDGVVDVEVVTQDAWTTQPGFSVGGKGGVTTYSFDLEEKDLLGTGRQLSVSYDKGIDRINRLLQYADPYVLGPYWNGNLLYSSNSDGEEERVSLDRPFYSFLSPWSAQLVLDKLIQNDKLYANGVVSEKFRQRHRQLGAQYGWALEASDLRARRLTAGFETLDDEFSILPDRPTDALPEDRRFRILSLQYEDVSNDFLKWNYINRDVRYEDFNLGRRYLARVGVSPSFLGLPRTTWLLDLEADQGWRLSPASFLLAEIAYDVRWDGSPSNETLSGIFRYVHKFQTRPLQTFVSKLQFVRGWNLDRDVQFFADGSAGLRGYRLHAFEGDKRVLWNLEHRVFSGKEILQLVSPGLAFFFDTGAAAPTGRSLRFSDLKSDAGVGLRFAISRAATNSILRIDFAYALDPDPLGRRGWLVSFSSGQEF
jgi:hypothetical protein